MGRAQLGGSGDVAGSTSGLELRHLRAFVAVAEELHFTRAAERLFLAQQALSAQIRQLENVVGESLFTRTTRRVQLTPAGEALLEFAPAVLALAEEGLCRARGAAAEGRARIRIAYTRSVSIVPGIIEALHEHAPGVRVQAEEVSRAEAVDGVRSGAFDVALVRAAPTEAALEATVVRTDRFSVTLGVAHPRARQVVVHCDELADSVLTFWPRDHGDLFERVATGFARNIEAGRVYEYENSSREGFLADAVARAEVLAGRAFGVRLVPSTATTPEGFVDRELEPAITADLYAVHRRSVRPAADGSAAEVAATVVRLARELPDA